MKTRALVMAACLLALSARADDWPQFRGPDRDNVSKEKGLLKKWPAGGPKLAWTYKDAGTGYSGPAIVGDTLYILGARGDDEFLIALDLTKNPPAEKWPAVKIGPTFTWKGNQWNRGPSTTPTVDGDLVFALGAQGDLVCATTAGKEKWRTNLPKNLKGEINAIGGAPEKIGWGYAGSPLVDGDNVICLPGGPDGLVAALNKTSGAVAWRSKNLTAQTTYSSPVVSNAGGQKQYVVMTQDGAAGVDAKTGDLLWEYKRESPYKDIVAATPLVKGDFVFISAAGSEGGCDLIEVKKDGNAFKATKVYAKPDLANFHGGMVLVGDHVYGATGDFGRSKWVCMEFKSGDVAWAVENRKLGKGSLTAADGYLYCLAEKEAGTDGALVVHTPASPKDKLTVAESFGLPEASKVRPQRGGLWTHPVVANGKLYLRDQELLFCYEVK
jgi:outer membrane protein assembly factor BamB